METPFETEAIVLRGSDFGESHRIITLFTKHKGKVKAIARGAKRSRKRFLNALEPFTLGIAEIKPQRTGGLASLEAMNARETFSYIRQDIVRYACAGLACELTDLWTREMSPEMALFQLLLWYLQVMNGTDHPYLTTIFFKAKLLRIVGYGPDWSKITLKGQNLSKGTLKSLAFIQDHPFEKIMRLRLSRDTMREAWRVLKAMHTRHLEKEPLSYNVLGQMNSKLAVEETHFI